MYLPKIFEFCSRNFNRVSQHYETSQSYHINVELIQLPARNATALVATHSGITTYFCLTR